MLSRRSAFATSAAVLWLAVVPPPAEAQPPFLDAVRDLAGTAATGADAAGDMMRRRIEALARMQAALAVWDRSIDTLESRIERELRDAREERAFQLRVELGLAYRQRGRLGDALREFDAAAAARPAASDVHLLRALTLTAAGKNAEAGRAFRTAWLRDADHPLKAYLALRQGSEQPGLGARDPGLDDTERARKVLDDALTRLLATEKPAGAASFFLVLDPVPDNLSRTPVVADALMATVFARLAEGRLDDALAAFPSSSAMAAGRSDDSPFAHFERGQAAEIQGRHADARRAYLAALAGTLTGRHVLYVGIGRLAQVEGDLDAAIEAFAHAVRLSPNDPVIHRELAGAYAAAGRFNDALAELIVALLLDPREVAAMAAVGQLLLDTDRAADAVAVLRRAVETNADSLETRYALAVALSRAGRAGEAARQFEEFERRSREALDHRRREVTGQAGPAGR